MCAALFQSELHLLHPLLETKHTDALDVVAHTGGEQLSSLLLGVSAGEGCDVQIAQDGHVAAALCAQLEASLRKGTRTLVGERVTVVQVQLAGRSATAIHTDLKGERIVRHLLRGASCALLARDHAATTLKDWGAVERSVGEQLRSAHLTQRVHVEPAGAVCHAGQVHLARSGSGAGDWRDQEVGADQVLVVEREDGLFARELEEERTHGRGAGELGLAEERVPVLQVDVALADGLAEASGPRLAEEPRLATLGVQVAVRAEEGLEGAGLVPAQQQLRLRVAEEAAHVRAAEADAAQAHREQHGRRAAHVIPARRVVTGPDGAVALRAGEEGSRQHERPLGVSLVALHLALGGGALHQHAVEVVQVAVLPAAGVYRVLHDGGLGAVEHGRLVHVVPGEERRCAALVAVVGELVGPPLARRGAYVVHPAAGAGPAPAVVGGCVRLAVAQHVDAGLLGALVHRVAAVALDVRVHDGDHAATGRPQLLLHAFGCSKVALVPGEVALAVRVLDVQPQHVEGNVVLVEAGVHRRHVRLVAVVPAALMVGDGELGRQRLRAGQSGVGGDRSARARRQHYEEIQHATLGHPVRVLVLPVLAARHVHPHLGGVQPEDAGGAIATVAVHHRHVAVQRHGLLELELEHVQVEEAVRLE
mmetsp:Transcript_17547/g.44716  ORF Transcript_17547/g.44716 Transcript_17547/m.44716 type:complete len:648 (-) Transcript_17547:7-1950(-)